MSAASSPISPDDASARELLVLLGELSKLLASFRQELARKHRAEHVRCGLECKNYESGPMVEIWAEADLSEHETLVYWMDLAPKATGWSISAHLSMNGSERIRDIAEVPHLTFQEIQSKAPEILRQLFSMKQT